MREASEILAALNSYRFNFATEEELQRGIAQVFDRHAITYEREYRLNAQDRPDFFIDGICVECKVDGSTQSLLRQAHRYAQHKEVKSILIVTNRTRHSDLPSELNGKPIVLHVLRQL